MRAKNGNDGDCAEEKKDGIDRVAVAKIGVGGVVDEREQEWNENERNCVRIATEKKKDEAKERGEGDASIEEEDRADKHGVGRKKIVPGRFGT